MTTPSDPHLPLLQAAVKAYAVGKQHRPQWRDKDALHNQLAVADRLLESQQLSIRNVSAITHLSHTRLAQRASAEERGLGGRLAPATLPLILDLLNAERSRETHSLSDVSVDLAKRIVEGGTSPGTVERLTGIPASTVRRWVAEA